MSSRDIDRGSLWFTEINDQLKDTSVGIIFLTKENMNRPWILFEAGALAKGLSTSRVCTFLVDLKPSDLDDPLAQFNHTLPNEEGLRSLVGTLNNCLGPHSLPIAILEQVFKTYWIQFQEKFNICLAIPASEGSELAEPKSEKDLLSEILENTRYLQGRIRSLELSTENGKSEQDQRPRRRPISPINLATRSLWTEVQLCRDAGLTVNETIEHLRKLGFPTDNVKEAIRLNPAFGEPEMRQSSPKMTSGADTSSLL